MTPFGQRADIAEFCSDNAIVVLCNEPLAKGIKLKHPVIQSIAEDLNITPEQVCINIMYISRFRNILMVSYFELHTVGDDTMGY